MDWIIFILVVVWLGIVSWFDIRKSEIPHSAWVIIPLIGACFYRAWQANWALVLLAILVATVSEREQLSHLLHRGEIGKLFTWFPLLFLGVYLSVQTSPFAALAIIGFWAAWELKWWGGADATAGITLVLLYPGPAYFIAFLAVHIFASVGLLIASLIRDKTIKMHRIPGLPLLFASALIFQIIYTIF